MLEQAAHFIKPIIENIISTFESKPEIKLVQSKSKSPNYAKELFSVLSKKNHDIFVSYVKNNTEYPLFFLEMSFAVPTKDHILQRFDGFSATSIAGYPYVKITSSAKNSSSKHGGGYLDPLIPHNLVQDTLPGSVTVEFDTPIYERITCPCEKFLKHTKIKTAPYHLQHKFENGIGYMACPGEKDHKGNEFEFYKNLTSFIDNCIKCVCNVKSPQDYQNELYKKLNKQNWYKKFQEKVSNAIPTDPSQDSTLTNQRNYIETVGGNHIVHKVGRFGHDLDPARGMTVYYEMLSNKFNLSTQELRTWFSTDKDTWYTSSSAENDVETYLATTGLKLPYDFLYCFSLFLGSATHDFQTDVMSKQNKQQKTCMTIDLDPFLNQHFLKLSRPFQLLFSCSNRYQLQYVEYKIKNGRLTETPVYNEKQPYKIDSQTKVIFNYTKQKLSNFNKNTLNLTPLVSPKESEDTLSYIITNSIIQKELKHGIYSVSYPGDQGGEPILLIDEEGRDRKRRNPDIFAQFKTHSGKNDDSRGVLLIEVKKKFSETKIKEDVDKIISFTDEESNEYASLLNTLQEKKLTKHNPNANPPNQPKVTLAVAFYNTNYTLERLKACVADTENQGKYLIDYAFVIDSTKKSWEIIDLNGKKDFPTLTGTYDIPEHFSIKS